MIFYKGGSPLITRQMQRRLRLMAGPVLVVALCCAFIPYSTDVSPAIELKVVGIDGIPLSGISVKRMWSSLWADDQETPLRTDSKGTCHLSRRSVTMSAAERLWILVWGVYPHVGWGSTLSDVTIEFENYPMTYERVDDCSGNKSDDPYFYSEPRKVVFRLSGVGRDRCYRVVLRPV